MEVILDKDQKPRGVFLPLEEWDMLKSGVSEASNLYKLMDELNRADIFDMNADEFSDYIRPFATGLVDDVLAKDSYVSYPADDNSPGMFVHQFSNGKKELIKIDRQTGREHFIRTL